MTGLLPHSIREAVHRESVFAASTSVGLVALILVLVLMIEWQAMQLRSRPGRVFGFSAVVLPLLVTAALTMLARLERILH